jgi:DNA polymerase/3'-5' exonuclease PolX
MSQGERIPLLEAKDLAERLQHELARYTKRCVIVGSIRRERPTVGDIDLLCEPLPPALSGNAIHEKVHGWGTVQLSGPKWIRLTHQGSHLPVDVFIVSPPAQWGVMLAARTGPATLWVVAKEELKKHGLDTEHGELHWVKNGVRDTRAKRPPCPDEESFFALARLPYFPPSDRDDNPKAFEPLDAHADAVRTR